MSFGDAIRKCFRKYATFKGRASRREYWWFTLLFVMFAWPLMLSEFENGLAYQLLSFIYFVATVAVLLPWTAVWVRRLHDTGRSGWHTFWVFVPLVGVVVIMRAALAHGDEGSNRYGDEDNEAFTRADHRTKGAKKSKKAKAQKEAPANA